MIQVLLLLAVTVRVSATAQEKRKHALMKINKHGYVDEKSFPTCSNGGKINLLSYRYQRCTTDRQCSTSLSPQAKLVIHEMCSLKRACTVSHFPHANAEINVTYQCLNGFKGFIDICNNRTKSDDMPMHLLYRHNTNNSANYKTCDCEIKGKDSTFSVIISDVRLKSATNGTCIQNMLYANFETLTCNDKKEDYGSVFNQIWKENVTKFMIKFNTSDSTEEPEMIYFTVKPKGIVTVACQNKRRIAAAFKGSAVKKTTHNDEDSTSSMTATIAGVCFAVALILVSAAVFLRHRTRNWKYTKWITNLERLIERRIQHPRDESNIQSPAQCIDDDEYVELKKKSSAPMLKNCREAGFDAPTDSSYDPVNNLKPVLGTADALDDIEDSTVYSYAKHQPEKRIIATQSSPSNPDDRTFSKVHGIANGDNVINKHVYVKLLPVQETAAGDCSDSVQLNTECDKSDVHQSEASNLKKTGVFNASEVNETILSYSFAKELYQASITAQLNSRNPEEPMSYSGKNQYDSTTSANKMKVSPSRNYDRAKKREISETPYASDDDCYDKINSDRIPVQINPNYDKLSK